MNKEVKEIVKSINTRKEYVGAPYMTLETKKIDLLLDYINQLETNRDEAIAILKLCNSQCSKEAISKLERGK